MPPVKGAAVAAARDDGSLTARVHGGSDGRHGEPVQEVGDAAPLRNAPTAGVVGDEGKHRKLLREMPRENQRR